MSTDKQDDLYAMRHSLAHIMATAVLKLWPTARLGVGPVVENGFYYDIDIPEVTISEDDFKKIEKEMHAIINQKQEFKKSMKPILEALQWADEAGQPYKLELLNDLRREGTTLASELDTAMMGLPAGVLGAAPTKMGALEVSFYTNGEFTDLCRGPHVEHTGKVGAFKLMRVAGAYWRGNEKNPQMQRLYGVAFATKEELHQHLQMLEEAKKRDHRVIGDKLDLFFFSDSVGAGLPLLTPRGETIKRALMDYMRELEEDRGYQYVSTPLITQRKLYERSGHADYYLENMYATKEDEEGNMFFIKPMNCPHHHMVYERLVKSFRDLPLRLSEHAGLYRYELSGTLTGLIRMRGPITQNDSHIYVTEEQLKSEFIDLLELFRYVYGQTGVTGYWFRLSLPDFTNGKYAGDQKKWEWAANVIRECLDQTDLPYVEELDEAAFYGPKLDVQIKNVLGKEDSIATVQIDILVPERMGITYVDTNNQKKFPIVIHKSIMGAFERFMGFLLEQTEGKLPVWLAPEQIRVITVNQEEATTKFAESLKQKAKKLGLRIVVDNDNESVGKKIRNSISWKVPYTLIVGEKEIETGTVTPRIRDDMQVQEPTSMPLENFLKSVANEAKSRVSRSSI